MAGQHQALALVGHQILGAFHNPFFIAGDGLGQRLQRVAQRLP